MESGWERDLVGSSGSDPKRKRAGVLWFAILSLEILLAISGALLSCLAQTSQPEADLAKIKFLYAEQRWQEIVSQIAQTAAPDAELEYSNGIALAHLGRLAKPRNSLSPAHPLRPPYN